MAGQSFPLTVTELPKGPETSGSRPVRSPRHRNRLYAVMVVVAVVVAVVAWGAATAGWHVFSPSTKTTPPPPSVTRIYNGSFSLQPYWSRAEGDNFFSWSNATQRSNPTLLTLSWTARFPASVCMIYLGPQSESYNYTDCAGAYNSSTSGLWTSGVWSFALPLQRNSSYSGYTVDFAFVEPSLQPGQNDALVGGEWLNNTTSNLYRDTTELAVVSSHFVSRWWDSPTIDLPGPGDSFPFYISFSAPVAISAEGLWNQTAAFGPCFPQSPSENITCDWNYPAPTMAYILLNYLATANLTLSLQVFGET